MKEFCLVPRAVAEKYMRGRDKEEEGGGTNKTVIDSIPYPPQPRTSRTVTTPSSVILDSSRSVQSKKTQ